MKEGRKYNKKLTTNTGIGLSNSATSNSKIVMPQSTITASIGNLQYKGETESGKVFTGVGDGEILGSNNPTPYKWGHTAPSGSRLEINDSDGMERIEMVHHTGAAVSIDPDGSVFITSSSARGGGLDAPYGDYVINAGGDILIKSGGAVNIETPGDLSLNVGGTFTLKCKEMSINTNNLDEVINGSHTKTVKNDESSIIGGICRTTIAGDSRKQITGKYIQDIGKDLTTRVGENHLTSTKGNHTTVVEGESNHTSMGSISSISEGNIILNGASVSSTPPIRKAEWSDKTEQANKAVIIAGANVAPPTLLSGEAMDPQEVEVMEAEDIVDSLTSERKYPNYPGNAMLDSADATAIQQNSGDYTPQADEVYGEYSGGNQGNVNPTYSSGAFETLPDTPINRNSNIQVIDNNTPIPSQNSLNTKISKYFTLAQIVNGTTTSHKPSKGAWQSTVRNAVLLAQNVLDPIKERFPSIITTSWYRPGNKNHQTGRAIDIVVHSRSLSIHAEIARFARDNLPVEKILMEKNDTGRTHVHLQLATGKGDPRVFTCGDKKCLSLTPGIDVEYLLRRGVKNT